MPTYVYHRADGTTFEVVQRITDPPLTEDPETGQPVQRVITSGPGLVFKGSGFYLTDYARAGEAKKSQEKPAGADPAPNAAAKTDAKPDPTPKADPS